MSSGTCQSNNRYDVPQKDCEAAAVALGLSDNLAIVETESVYPPGCYWYSGGILFFNLEGTSAVNCGTIGDDCLCGALGTGGVHPFPLHSGSHLASFFI